MMIFKNLLKIGESNSVSKDILFEEIGIKSVISFKDVAGVESYFDEINRKN